jgi:predicted ATPase/class 3 adenylate cyclase
MRDLPIGTVTFLFTDVEGSTRLWERNPAAMKRSLAFHDEILHDAVRTHGGRVVKEMGDGMLAVFPTAQDALVAAAVAQVALGSADWGETGPLRVRMSLHTGEPENRNGDYFGPVLNRASRLMAAAHGGQVVVSQVTEGILHDALPASLELVDLGEHRLRDLSGAERVFQLIGPGLKSRFPVLRSVEAVRGNLPTQVTSFLGRENELKAVPSALAESRLVTLTGVGGVGKTRLALQVAAKMLPDYPDGVWLCELAPVRDAGAVEGVAAAVFGVTARPGQTPIETLVDYLRTKRLLFVIDNCEHVLEPAAGLARAISLGCPQVAVLATSRERLGAEGERIIGVLPLSAPAADADVKTIAESDAARLFVDRAAAATAGFALNPTNAQSVAEICRRLDGIPLALELAAARAAVMSASELARRLDQRFRILAGSGRGATERHQTLRSAIDWSYALLSDSQQRLLGRLSVFAGGCTLEAAEKVVAGNGADPDLLFEDLTSLVARSLVVADVQELTETRYRLLEIIREYAEERLREHGDLQQVQARHGRFFATWAERASQMLRGSDEAAWTRRVALEQENLRKAMAWAIDVRNLDAALGLLAAAKLIPMYFLPVAGVLSSFADAAVALDGAAEHPLSVAALVQAATFAWSRGDLPRAAQLSDEAAKAEERLGTRPDAYILGAQALLAIADGRIDDAIELWARSIVIDRQNDDKLELGLDLGVHAFFRALNDDSTSAIAEATEGLAVARGTGNPTALAYSLSSLGFVLSEADPKRARALLEEGIERSESLGRPDPQAVALLALIATRQGDHRMALALSARALDLQFWFADRISFGAMLEILAHALVGEAPESAAVLQGAANALDPGYAGFRQLGRLRDRTAHALAATIGEARASELRSEGQTMDSERAGRYARTQIDLVLSRM